MRWVAIMTIVLASLCTSALEIKLGQKPPMSDTMVVSGSTIVYAAPAKGLYAKAVRLDNEGLVNSITSYSTLTTENVARKLYTIVANRYRDGCEMATVEDGCWLMYKGKHLLIISLEHFKAGWSVAVTVSVRE